MSIVDRARTLRATIETLSVNLDDETALENVELFPHWKDGAEYQVDDRVSYGDTLFKCLTAHTSQSDWTPDAAVSLWV